MTQYPQDYPATSAVRQDDPLTVIEPMPADEPSTADVAKDQASQVKDSATDAAQHVAEVAKEQAGNVADEARAQAKDLLDQTRRELRDQAATQQERIASGLRSLEHELHSMAAASTDHGIGADLAGQAADRAGTVAQWMEGRDPGELLEEVRSFARQRPATFLGIAAVAGLVAGRLGRGLQAGPSESGPDHASPSTEFTSNAGSSGVPGSQPAPYQPAATTLHPDWTSNEPRSRSPHDRP